MKKRAEAYTQSIYGVLAILSQGPKSGYDIRKALEDPEIYYWRESFGNIYPMLRVLLKDGLLSKQDSYVKKKKKVIYELNEKGLVELQKWLSEPAKLNRYRIEMLMKLRFGSSCGVENMLAQISNYRSLTEGQIKEAQEIVNEIESSGESLDNQLRMIAIRLFLLQKESLLEWCDESFSAISRWKEK